MHMKRPVVSVSVAPGETPVTLAELKSHLRVDWDDEDDELQAYLEAAVETLDGPKGQLASAIVSQTWHHVCGGADHWRVRLTADPVALVSIKYLDGDEVEQTATLADFRVESDGFDYAVVPVTGKSWPDMACRADALRITYTTGAEVSDVPKPLKQAVKLLAAHWYKEREHAAAVNLREIPFAVSTLIQPYKRGFAA